MQKKGEIQIEYVPLPDSQTLISQIQKEMLNPPDEIEVTVKLTGLGARRYNVLSKILEIGFNEPSNEIAKYIMRAGVEREFERMIDQFKVEYENTFEIGE